MGVTCCVQTSKFNAVWDKDLLWTNNELFYTIIEDDYSQYWQILDTLQACTSHFCYTFDIEHIVVL